MSTLNFKFEINLHIVTIRNNDRNLNETMNDQH